MCVGRRGVENNPLVEYRASGQPDFDAKNLEKIIPIEDQQVEVPKGDFKEDLLALMTQQTKCIFHWINYQYQRFLTSVFYK